DEPLRFLLDTVAGLGGKLGPLLLQLPPNFRKDVGRLDAPLALVPPTGRIAVEFPHASWLRGGGYPAPPAPPAAPRVADPEEGTTPDVVTTDFGYLRLRDRAYEHDELVRWARIAARPEWRDAFVYFKHEESGTGPALARELIGLLATADPS